MVAGHWSVTGLVTSLLATTASAGHIAAWWTNDFGPALIMQDDATGAIRYSLCNSRNTPILPNDTSITIPLLQYPPKMGTALAGGGWFDSQNVIASIFYFNDNDEIVNALLQCNSQNGHWSNTQSLIVSGGTPRAAKNSDLNVALLGAELGYRLFYNDLDGAVQMITYNQKDGWRYGNVAYNASSSANIISCVFPPNDNNMTIIVPRDENNMGLSRFYGDNTWHIESFPTPLKSMGNATVTNSTNPKNVHLNTTSVPSFQLPAWDGKPLAMGMAEDSHWTRSVFYIGTDDKLHQIGNLDYQWQVFSDGGDSAWPKADSGYLAVANEFTSSSLRVYYMSGGKLIEANGDNGKWEGALALPSYNATAADSNDPEAAASDSSELSTGAKAGIGIGVSLGVIAIIGIVVAFCVLKRRQKRQQGAAADSTANGSTAAGSAPPEEPKYYTPETTYSNMQTSPTQAELYTPNEAVYPGSHQWQQQHVASNQVYEMPDQPRRAEMVGEGHYKEAP